MPSPGRTILLLGPLCDRWLSDLYLSAYIGAEFFQLCPSVQVLARKDSVVDYANNPEASDRRYGVLDLVSVWAEFEKGRCRSDIAADSIDVAGMSGRPLRVSGGMASNGGGKISSPVAAMKSALKFLWEGRVAAGRCGVENQQGPYDTQQQTQGKRLQASAHGAHPSDGKSVGRISASGCS